MILLGAQADHVIGSRRLLTLASAQAFRWSCGVLTDPTSGVYLPKRLGLLDAQAVTIYGTPALSVKAVKAPVIPPDPRKP